MRLPRHSGQIPDAWRAVRYWVRHRPRFWPLLRFMTRSREFERGRVHLRCSASIPEPFDVDRLCRLWETAQDELAAWFGFSMAKPVTLLLFATEAELRRAFGDDSRGGALLRPNAVALPAGGAAGGAENSETIRHELVHLFSVKWGRTVPSFKREGLASWLQGTDGGKAIDFKALVRVVGEGCSPLSRLLNREAWESREWYAYPLAGSFTGFLISRYGREQYKEFFAKASEREFEHALVKVFGQDLLTLERQWLAQLLGRRSEFEPELSRAIAECRAGQAYSRWELHRCIEEVETSARGGFASTRGLQDAGWACRIIGEYAKAADFFRQALLTWTEDSRIPRAKLWLALGECQDLGGHRDDAIHAYRQALGEVAVIGADDASARRSAEERLQRPYSVSEWFEELRSWERD